MRAAAAAAEAGGGRPGRPMTQMTLHRPTAAGGPPLVLFVTPLVSRRYASDWEAVCRRTAVTLRSLANQTSGDWSVLLIGSECPEVPQEARGRVHFLELDLTIDDPARKGRREVDKERKLYWALRHLPEIRPRFILPMDYDDLVRADLVRTVGDLSGTADGILLRSGYVYRDGERHVQYSRRIHTRTGTNYCLRYRPEDFPAGGGDFCDPPPDDYRECPAVSSHVKWPPGTFAASAAGPRRWRVLRPPSVVWRRNADSISNAYAGRGGAASPWAARARRAAASALFRRPLTDSLNAAFGCPAGTGFGLPLAGEA